MKTVAVAKFKAKCLRLLEEVRQTGKPLLVTKRGAPLAQIGPPPAERTAATWLGCMRHRTRILGDIVEPAVPPEDWKINRD